MYDTSERVSRIKLRAEELEHKKENRLIGGLLSMCIILSTFLLGFFTCITGGGHCLVTGFFGSMLMYEDAGSHVLVGLISFVVGVAITVLCIRIKEKNKKTKSSIKDE